MKITMNNSKDEKYKSNKESILRNWKTLKQCIEPEPFVQELERGNFLLKSSFENLAGKSRSHQATLVLIAVYRTIQSYEKMYEKFLGILRRHNSAAADALTNPVDGPINNTGSVDQHTIEQQSNLLKRFGKKLKNRLKRNPQVVLEITDNLIECGLLNIDEVEQILHSPKGAHEPVVEFINTNIHLGAYSPLLQTLKSEKKLEDLASDLTTAGVSEDTKTAKHILQEKRNPFPVVTRENTYRFYLSINGLPENQELNKELLDRHSPVEISLFKHTGSTIENKKEGSATFRFGYFYPNNVIAVKGKIQQGVMPDMMYDTMKYMGSRALDRVSQLHVTLRCSNNKTSNMSTTIQPLEALPPDVSTLQNIPQALSEQQATEAAQRARELVQHTMNVTIIAANRSFLIEEINTMALVRAFKDEGITCFDGLDGTLERQQRAECFLTILEKNDNLLDQLLVILREQGMTYVLGRLNSCRNAYSADPQILERNISRNRFNIFDSLDIYAVRGIFIERGVFSSRMFDEIEEKYSESEDQMSAVLIEIIKSGPRAMQILVDALYMNQADSLADSLRRGTPNELQEMHDNTETDESSSDGELLYKATFVVSKADGKPQFHQMSEHKTVSVPSK